MLRALPSPIVRPLALAALLASAPPAAPTLHAQAAPIRLERPVVLRLTPYGNGPQKTVRVRVGDEELDFFLDTGGGATWVHPDIARRLGCTPDLRIVGFRLSGERIENDACAALPLGLGPITTMRDVIVDDILRFLGPNAPKVHGMITLTAFEGYTVTLDMAGNTLTLESPASLARRVRDATPVRMKFGGMGRTFVPFVEVGRGDRTFWFEFDTGNQSGTIVAPHVARLLGMGESDTHAELPLRFGPGRTEVVPVAVRKEMIHDGVLSNRFIARSVWTFDLAAGRAWMAPGTTPLLGFPPAGAQAPAAVSVEPAGTYAVTLLVNGSPRNAVVRVARDGKALGGQLRFLNTDGIYPLESVEAEGGALRFVFRMGAPVAVALTFDGTKGAGTWGEPGKPHGGTASAEKRG